MKSKKLSVFTVLVVAELVTCGAAAAQSAGVPPPQASQLPPPPVEQRSIPDIRVDRAGVTPDAGPIGPSVLINSLHVSGATRFSEAQLVAATGFVPGSSLTLGDLRRMAARISNYYSARGYIVAQAYVPAQDIRGGAVTIVVIEGRYGEVRLRTTPRCATAWLGAC